MKKAFAIGWLRRVGGWEGFLALLVLGVAVWGVVWVPGFATAFNLSQIAAGVSEKALLVLPMVLLIIAREIDLSVASILALCGVVLGLLVRAEVPLGLAVVATFAVGAAAGALNGLLVTRLMLPSLVVTLGTMALFRGLGYILLGTGSISELPEALTDFGIENVPGTAVPWIFVPFLLLAPVFAVCLHRSAAGRRIYAIGGSPDAARYTGIRVARLRLAMFIASGLVCALASVVLTARLSSARASNGLGFELDVITIALLGGIRVFGGHGRFGGVFWALLLVALVRNLLGLQQVGGDAQGFVVGCLLIVSLLLGNGVRKLATSATVRRWLQRFSPPGPDGPTS